MRMRLFVFFLAVLSAGVCAAGEITNLKPFYPETELAVGREARTLIVTGTGRELRGAAREAASRIRRQSGASVPVIPAEDIVSSAWEIDFNRIDGKNIIAIGNINNNRLLSVLYGERYVISDSIYPGRDGYVVRTVHDPFGKGINVLVLAGSDGAGARKAVDVLFEKHISSRGDIVLEKPIVNIRFEPTREPFLPGEGDWGWAPHRAPQFRDADYFMGTGRGSLQAEGFADRNGNIVKKDDGNLVNLLGAIGRMAETYFWTGEKALPPLMKEVLDKNRHLLERVPDFVMDASRRNAAAYLHWWNVVETLPVWTDRDRLDVTNAFLSDSRQAQLKERKAFDMVEDGYIQVVDHNHGTSAAMGSFSAWNYFDKYYDLPEAERWMDAVRAIFAGQWASHQILEDASGYLCYCPSSTMSYAFASGDLRFFEREVARTYAEFIAQAVINNMGLGTGFGDDNNIILPQAYDVIAKAAWHYRDPRLNWILQNIMHSAKALNAYGASLPFDLTVDKEEPAEWTGLSLLPVYKQTLRTGEGSKEFVSDPPESAGDEWFNKIVFREAWDAEAQYLLLDGAGKYGSIEGYPDSPSHHRHEDVNCIINLSDRGRMWMVDHAFDYRSIRDQSGLYITRNGSTSYTVKEAHLRDFAEAGERALVRSVFKDFSGADWERTIFWEKGEHFLVVDRAIASEAGNYTVRCSFRGLGEHELRGSGMRLEQDGRYFDIVSDGQSQMHIELFDLPSGQWDSWYPYAEPVSKILQQDKTAKLEPGDAVSFVNLLRAADSAEELDAVELAPVSETSALVRVDMSETLYGVDILPGNLGKAGSFAVSSDSALLGGAERLGPESAPVFESDTPVTLYFDREGRGWIESRGPAGINIGGREFTLSGGRREIDSQDLSAFLERVLAEAAADSQAYAEMLEAAEEEIDFGLSSREVHLNTPVSDMVTIDITGDGEKDWVVAGEEVIAAFTASGEKIWEFISSRPFSVLTAGDVTGDGRPEIAAGWEGERVYLFDAEGNRLWNFRCRRVEIQRNPAVPKFIEIADLNNDGNREIIVGASWVHCLNPDGSLKWERVMRPDFRGRTRGEFAAGAVDDFSGDGKLEVLALYADGYPLAFLYDSEGEVLIPTDYDPDVYGHQGLNIRNPEAVVAVDLYGKGEGLQFVAGTDSRLSIWWAHGEHIARYGGGINGNFAHLSVYEPAGERPFVYGANSLGMVFAIQAGEPRADRYFRDFRQWDTSTGERISALWSGKLRTEEEYDVLVGSLNGAVLALDGRTGELRGRLGPTGSEVVKILNAGNKAIVVHADGKVQFVAPAE